MNRTLHPTPDIVTWSAILMTVASLLFIFSSPLLAAPNPQDNTEQTLLVHFDAGTTPEMRAALIAQMGGELVTWMHPIDVAEIRLPVQEGVTVAALPMMANEIVAFAEPDLLEVYGL